MCLLLIAHGLNPDYPLVIAANRDEFHQRPTEPAHWWEDGILAGRDLQAGGTWFGVNRQGRFAALTNFRDPADNDPGRASRGALVVDALRSMDSPAVQLRRLAEQGARFNGFNLVFGDIAGLYSFSNREGPGRALPPGLYGLSNHLLETPWPKVLRGKKLLREHVDGGRIEPQALFEMLADEHRPDDADLPRTGVTTEWERLLSPMFIVSPAYGTRSSAVVAVRADGEVLFAERRYTPEGIPSGESEFRFKP